MASSSEEERGAAALGNLFQVCVLFGFINAPEFLHVFLDVLFCLVLHVLVAFQVLGVFAVLQLFVHHSVGQLGRWGETTQEAKLRGSGVCLEEKS